MAHSRHTLKNGMRVHLVPFSGTDAATVFVLFKVGSRYEVPSINGAAHYIEHLMFKGTKRRPSTTDISRTLDAIGADYNAFTSKSWTGYHIKAEAGHLPLAVDMLSDMLFHSKFDNVEMDRERGVIVEEINMYRDNPMMRVDELLEEKMFAGSPLGWNIGGTEKTMRTMTREAVLAFRNAYYTPDRAVIAIAGKVDTKILPLLEKTFGKVAKGKKEPAPYLPAAIPAPGKALRCISERKATKQIQVALGFPSFPIGDPRNPAVHLLATILGGTMSSRLFIQVRERKGLCYFIRAGNTPVEDTGTFVIQSGIEAARLPLALRTIKAEIGKIKASGITPTELAEAKENIRGRLMLALEDSSERADWFATQELFMPKVHTPEQYLRAVADVSAAQVKAAAKEILDLSRMTVAAIGPFKDEKEFLKKAGL
jgi:predicted Zn-dependent peptidase